MDSKILNFSLDDVDAKTSINISETTANDIAVVGIACQFPKARDLDEFWGNLCEGKDCVDVFPQSRRREADKLLRNKSYPKDDIEFIECGFLDSVEYFDYQFFGYSLKEASLLDPAQRLFLQVAYHCIEDAGYSSDMLKGTNTGVYLGYSNDFETERTYKRFIDEIENEVNAMAMVGNTRAVISARVSHFLDLRGPNLTIDTTCSSSLVAIHTACQALRTLECDLAIAGGVELHLLPIKGKKSEQIGIEASDYRTKSFDNNSDGTGNGEGVGAVLLKPLNKALADNDHIYCIVKGGAVNQNGSSMSITVPNARAQEELLVKAWASSGISPETITLIEAHGSGTHLGDPIEMEGLKRAFDHYTKNKQFCAIGSVKTNLGHLGGAAGIASFIKICKCLQEKKMVPLLHFQEPNQSIPFHELPVYINNELCEWGLNDDIRIAGISSYGLSGTNCHLVLEEYSEDNSQIENDEKFEVESIFVLSARSENMLRKLAEEYIVFLSKQHYIPLEDICGTLIHGRSHYKHRLALIVSNTQEIVDKLKKWINSPENCGENVFCKNCKSAQGRGVNIQKLIDTKDNLNVSLLGLNEESKFYSRTPIEICNLYIEGLDIPWHQIWNRDYVKLSLPKYPFEKSRCWFDIKSNNKLYSKIEWIHDSILVPTVTPEKHNVLVICDSTGYSKELCTKFKSLYETITVCDISDFVTCIQSGSNKVKDYIRGLIESKITEIVYFASNFSQDKLGEISAIQEHLNKGIFCFHKFIQEILNFKLDEKLNIYVIAQNVNKVTELENQLNPINAILFGYISAVNHESNLVFCRGIDIDNYTDSSLLSEELISNRLEPIVAYRENKRYIKTLDYYEIPKDVKLSCVNEYNGAYIITGGTGGLGLEIATYLAGNNYKNIILIKKQSFPKECEFKDILNKPGNSKLKRKIKTIEEIKRQGCNLEILTLDITDESAVSHAFDEIRKKYNSINGIIHAAGKAGDGLIKTKSHEKFNEVLAPKVLGTLVLDKVTQKDELDFFILFSSVAVFIPVLGQSDYIASNMFLDAYSEYRNKENRKTLCINWAMWKETGMAVDYGINESTGFHKLLTSEAIEAFDKLMYSDLSNIVVGEINFNDLQLQPDAKPVELSENIMRDIESKNKIEYTFKDVQYSIDEFDFKLTDLKDGLTDNEMKLAAIWAEALNVEEISLYDNFYDLGGNSLLAVHLLNRLDKVFPNIFNVSDIFSYPTISSMAEYLDKKLGIHSDYDDIDIVLAKLENGEISELEAARYLEKR
ncbi:Ketoacyl-synthetase C-terminal extension [Clostridium cavendishii DSM 21758]|uniref:Ketoacyl-synthetase C-terminal extension n=1 Tax=Clostridium cavendishii DSM 21758 TaxID=1121302 RepID=A0A1M6MSN7_9CLOT|nr:SDR family NAD(P)-dependent oxidoreductase [Clostridium cavendishii]SHJ86535.1 Ketoacyl-synthetase C-terminal extension [Clostridium cavendishii DSM 21758]